MKITQLNGSGKSLKIIELSTVMVAMKSGEQSREINTLRDLLACAIPDKGNIQADKIPVLMFAAVFRKKENGLTFVSYNGLILLEVGELADNHEVARMKLLASQAPQTLAAFAGSSGRTVKILVPFVLPDGTLPHDKELAAFFHAMAYRRAVNYYQAQLQCNINIKTAFLEQGCRYSYDPELYYNPTVIPLTQEQPMQMPDEITYRETVAEHADPLLRLMLGYHRSYIVSRFYTACMQDALDKTDEFMKRRYEFRRNMLMGEVEYRARGSFYTRFAPVTETVLNTIGLNAQAEGLALWDRDVKRYIYTDSIDFGNKRNAELLLSRLALINIDEFDAVGPSYQSFFKHVLQKLVVNARQPYKRSIEALHRYASFIATCNNYDLLSDPTGSRRFICIEIMGMIDTSVSVNYDQLYAQASAALIAGERYWFTSEEESSMTKSNEVFQQVPVEEQLFLQYFRAALPEETSECLSLIEITLYLQKRSGVKLSNKRLSYFGRLLQKNKIPSRRTKKGTCYYVVKME